jgi:hypothetical protein
VPPEFEISQRDVVGEEFIKEEEPSNTIFKHTKPKTSAAFNNHSKASVPSKFKISGQSAQSEHYTLMN